MNNRLIISSVIIGLWVAFVIYCLFNGSKIAIKTRSIKNTYWILTALAVDFSLYLINGISTFVIVLMFVMLFATALYISIPSGYSDHGIYIRGLCFPFSKIEDMNVERVLRTNRLNFKCFHRIFYIDSDSYKDLKDCETLFKKEKYHD